MIEKKDILNFLKNKILEDLSKAKEALRSVKSLATHAEMKQEGKYDTRSIEAGYLAGAQTKRVEELEQELQLIDSIPCETSKKNISLGSIVKLENKDLQRWYYLSSTSGGTLIPFEKGAILVVSVFSPLGSELIDLEVNEEVMIEQAGKEKTFKILEVL